MEKKEVTIKDERAFRLKIRHWKSISPANLNSIEFVQECIDKDGEVDFASTYNFLMTNEELNKLADSLKEIANDTKN